ncbi:hypothetical protein ACIREO_19520 [Streptomyces sp. NPDC102441]|uniref:hypothetical protein n=1 Tax=Streptomyces sp. NPDC102441 TaxID=3366176 RepID=UPI003806EBFA
MFRKHVDVDRGTVGHEEAGPRPVLFLEVLVDLDGVVLVDGDPFPVPDGVPVNVAVLDTMQRRARAGGAPVEAVIVDRQAGYATRIEVTADGASRIVRHERYPEPSGTESRPARGSTGTGSRPAERHITALPSEPGPSPAGPSAEDVRPADVGSPVPVPDELAELVARIGQAIDTGALERAAALAFRLKEHATRTFGAEHPYTLEAQALEAFAAHRSGNHAAATLACLELAQIRHQQGDLRAHEDLLRAVAVWQLIDDLPSAVNHGRALLTTWSRLADDNNVAAGDLELVRGVDRRIHALATGAGTHPVGVA